MRATFLIYLTLFVFIVLICGEKYTVQFDSLYIAIIFNELKNILNKQSWPNLKYCLWIYLYGLKKST
jgi:hypothetical protein